MTLNDQLDIDRQLVFSSIGYQDDDQPSARIASLVDRYMENCHDLVTPSYSYVIKDIKSVHGDRINIEESIVFKSKVIARLLKRCEKVAVYAATVGNRLEEMVTYLAENGSVLQATVLDVIGSNAAEQLAAYVEEGISEEANSQGLCISRRFSPGYCDWEIDQQRMVFGAMKNDLANIRLTGDYLMIPQKSISGIVGLGPCDIENYNPCMTCKEQDCPGRR